MFLNRYQIKTTLKNLNLYPNQRLGQNFLTNHTVVQRMVGASELDPKDIIVEVGAGLGQLTEPISQKVKKLYVFEIDSRLIPFLKTQLKDKKNVEIIHQDFLDSELLETENITKVVGSIPYQITSPLIHKVLKNRKRPRLMVLLIQKEVAEKICALPPKATYLSNFVRLFGQPRMIKTVGSENFYPQPQVTSAIIKIEVGQEKLAFDPQKFERFLHHGFNQPRKMLNKKFDKNLLRTIEINPQKRAQALTLEEWVKLYLKLHPDQK